MHTHRKTLLAIGIILLLMPFIALPYAWKGWLAAACGALVVITVFIRRRIS